MNETIEQTKKRLHDEEIRRRGEQHRRRMIEKHRKDGTVSTWSVKCACGDKLVFKGRRDKACAYFDRQGWMALKDSNEAICGDCIAAKTAEAAAATKAPNEESQKAISDVMAGDVEKHESVDALVDSMAQDEK